VVGSHIHPWADLDYGDSTIEMSGTAATVCAIRQSEGSGVVRSVRTHQSAHGRPGSGRELVTATHRRSSPGGNEGTIGHSQSIGRKAVVFQEIEALEHRCDKTLPLGLILDRDQYGVSIARLEGAVGSDRGVLNPKPWAGNRHLR
jgi:hypothetical protein